MPRMPPWSTAWQCVVNESISSSLSLLFSSLSVCHSLCLVVSCCVACLVLLSSLLYFLLYRYIYIIILFIRQSDLLILKGIHSTIWLSQIYTYIKYRLVILYITMFCYALESYISLSLSCSLSSRYHPIIIK